MFSSNDIHPGLRYGFDVKSVVPKDNGTVYVEGVVLELVSLPNGEFHETFVIVDTGDTLHSGFGLLKIQRLVGPFFKD